MDDRWGLEQCVVCLGEFPEEWLDERGRCPWNREEEDSASQSDA